MASAAAIAPLAGVPMISTRIRSTAPARSASAGVQTPASTATPIAVSAATSSG
jgi:hypothetical protein